MSKHRLESAREFAERLDNVIVYDEDRWEVAIVPLIKARDIAVVRAVLELTAQNFDVLRDTSNALFIRAMAAHPDEVLSAITQPRRERKSQCA